MARERTLSEQAFEQFPQALILVDRDATVLSLNAVGERLTGWASRDAIGRPAADILEIRTETGFNLCAPTQVLRASVRPVGAGPLSGVFARAAIGLGADGLWGRARPRPTGRTVRGRPPEDRPPVMGAASRLHESRLPLVTRPSTCS